MFTLPNGEHALDALMNAIDHEMEVDAFLCGDSSDLEEAYGAGIINELGFTSKEIIDSREAFTRIFKMD